jgi:hypothetical protein
MDCVVVQDACYPSASIVAYGFSYAEAGAQALRLQGRQ